jgi:hypothetical protein
VTTLKSAIELIEFIARDYVELSHDKVLWQRNDHMKRCRQWLDDYYAECDKQTPEDDKSWHG